MKKNILIFGIVLLFLGFLVFNYSNRSNVVTPSSAALACPPNCIPPTVITHPASSITTTGATLNGETTSAGGGNLFEVGFEYGLTPSYGSTTTETPTFDSAGTFFANITSLACGNTYHYRAYASNQQNTHPTGYGTDRTFITNSCAHYSSGRTSSSTTSSPSETSTTTSSTSGSSSTTSPSGTPPPTTVSPAIIPPTSPIPSGAITGTLVFGSTGNEVKILQAGLNNDGFKSGPVDGIFGPITKGAVIRFQLAHGLVGDGIFGIKSRAAWNNR